MWNDKHLCRHTYFMSRALTSTWQTTIFKIFQFEFPQKQILRQ